ncbi:hypothetical protein [Streptomyces sp. NPDC007088]|uniref:hypothetical protein n=1 Tax=Streptomyces sp. NPDC007088 TaxID=3364773 RepID=UPI0036A43089
MSGGGDHTRLDLDVIKAMGQGLAKVKKAFDGLDDLGNSCADDFGDGDLAGKFEDFANNWKISREKLTAEVDALATIAKEAAKAYESVDHQLAEAIRGAQPEKKGK